MADINKIGALCIRNGKLLIVHKKNVGYICLGGKIEQGETDEQCLHREIKEEINCTPTNIKYFDTFEGPTHDFKRTLKMTCYFVDIQGEPRINPDDSVNDILWIDNNYHHLNDLAHMLKTQILPALINKKLL